MEKTKIGENIFPLSTPPLQVLLVPSSTSRRFPGLQESLKCFDLLFFYLGGTISLYPLFSSFRTRHNYAGDVFEAAISPWEAESCCLAIADTENVYKHMERRNFEP